MRNGNGKLNVPHSATAFTRDSDFNTATVANNALKFDTLILPAGAFIVAHRTENTLAEESARFRFERAVINGFRIFDFPVRPLADHIRRSERNRHIVKILLCGINFRFCVIDHCSVKFD